MSETPTPKQALILWCLLGRHGSALQSEVAPKVGKADREALIAGRFLATEKQGRSLRLTVTDRGWDWAGTHLHDPLPASFRVLQDWLARIDAHLAATGASLAELIGQAPERVTPGQAAPAPKPGRASAKKAPETKAARPKPLTAPQLRARIEQAYLAVTGGRKAEAVRLSALRAQLADLDRATVDSGLAAILRGDGTARLSQYSDPKTLTTAEREAAYSPAGEPFHILWIQS